MVSCCRELPSWIISRQVAKPNGGIGMVPCRGLPGWINILLSSQPKSSSTVLMVPWIRGLPGWTNILLQQPTQTAINCNIIMGLSRRWLSGPLKKPTQKQLSLMGTVPCSRELPGWRGTPPSRRGSLRRAPVRRRPAPWWWGPPRTDPRRHHLWPPLASGTKASSWSMSCWASGRIHTKTIHIHC